MDVCSVFSIHHTPVYLCELWMGKIMNTVFLIGTFLWEWTTEREKRDYGAWNTPGLCHIIIFCFLGNWNIVVSLCTTTFNIIQFYILATQCIYVFCIDLRTVAISLCSRNWFVFINPTRCISFLGKSVSLNIILINHSP